MNPIEKAAGVAENHSFQEIFHLFDRLEKMGIGKPLYVAQKTSALSKGVQVKTGIETPEETTLVKVGHALPADENDTSHVIIAPDGSIIFITASTKLLGSVDRYKDLFCGGTEPIPKLLLPAQGTAQTIVDSLRENYPNLPIESILDGRLPEQYPQVKTKFDQALTIAQKRKEAIEETRLQMKNYIVAGLKSLLEPPSSAPTTPPPATPAAAA